MRKSATPTLTCDVIESAEDGLRQEETHTRPIKQRLGPSSEHGHLDQIHAEETHPITQPLERQQPHQLVPILKRRTRMHDPLDLAVSAAPSWTCKWASSTRADTAAGRANSAGRSCCRDLSQVVLSDKRKLTSRSNAAQTRSRARELDPGRRVRGNERAGERGSLSVRQGSVSRACNVSSRQGRTEDAKSTLRASPSVAFLVGLSSASVDIVAL